MFCPNCRTENRDDSDFCKECGWDLSRYKQETPKKAGWQPPVWLIGLLAFFLVAASVLAALVFFDIDLPFAATDISLPGLGDLTLPGWLPFGNKEFQPAEGRMDDQDDEDDEGDRTQLMEPEEAWGQEGEADDLTEQPPDDSTAIQPPSADNQGAPQAGQPASGQLTGKIIFTC